MFALAGLAVIAFVTTNIDDLVVLVAFFAVPKRRPAQVVAGQLAGMAVLVGLSVCGALLGIVVPGAWLGAFGLVPISIGVRGLWRRQHDLEAELGGRPSAADFTAVTIVTVANGGDNMALYVSLFSVHPAAEVAFFVAVFAVLTLLWCAVAYALVQRGSHGASARRWGEAIIPYAMIALGAYIVIKTGALALLWSSLSIG